MNARSLFLVLFVLLGYSAWAQTDSIPLKVGIKVEPPFIIQDVDGAYTGLSVDLWRAIAAAKGVDYELVEHSDQLGLIRALDFGEIDLTINPLHVNETRLRILEATQPFFVSSVGVAIGQAQEGQITIFIKNLFSVNFIRVLLLLVLVIFVFGFLLWAAERHHNPQQFRKGWIGLFDGLWWSAVTMTTVGYGDKAPKTRLGRVVAMVWMFTAIIIISGFTASIASTLTVNSLSRSVTGLEDLAEVERLGTVRASSSHDFLKAYHIQPQSLYNEPEAAIRALSTQKIELLVYDKAVLEYYINVMELSGELSLLPPRFNQQYRSFFLPKHSPHLQWINPLLVRQINEASWQDLLRKYNLLR